MKVEATWRGEGRLELLLVGVKPADAEHIIETLEATAGTPDEPLPLGPVGWAVGFEGSAFFPAVWHRWSGRRMSACRRQVGDKIKWDRSAANTPAPRTPLGVG